MANSPPIPGNPTAPQRRFGIPRCVHPWRRNAPKAPKNRLPGIKFSDSLVTVGRGPTENQEHKYKPSQETN
jgi:hypothetical protein